MDEHFITLTNLAYKIIDFYPESDPLKHRTKEKVLSIMDGFTVLDLMDGWASFQIEKTKSQLVQEVRILLNYFVVARNQGYLNPTNFLILSKEYDDIVKEAVLTTKKALPYFPEKTQKVIQAKVSEPKKVKKESNSLVTDRQKQIVDFLQENEKAQVMDLLNILKGVTKRTIRRDLNELLKRGDIVRVGKFNQVFYKLGH